MSTIMAIEEEAIDAFEKRRKYMISVVGCGRMGLPTACLLAEAGYNVTGVDADRRVVNLIKKGKAPFLEPGLNELIEKHTREGRLTATNNVKEAASTSDVITIIVPTRIDEKKRPDYSQAEKACTDVGMGLRSGSLVIFESTMGPGGTEKIVKKALEDASGLKAGGDFGLAYSPIRASVGRVLQDIANYPRVVGAIDGKSLKVACLILRSVVKSELIAVKNIKTAEAVKLFENVYRDVNLALSNELGCFCERAGIDFVEAQKAANTQPYCHLLIPGLVSGHIPTDPYLLLEESENLNVKLGIVRLARATNDGILDHSIRLVGDALRSCEKTFRRAKIAVLGVSYRPNVKETRGSLVRSLVDMLNKKGASVQVYDPFFSYKELVDLGYPTERVLAKVVESADCILITVGHDQFRKLSLAKLKFLTKKAAAIVDLGHVIDPLKAKKEGFVYSGLGRGVD